MSKAQFKGRTLVDLLPVLLVVLGALIATARLWQPGIVSDADMLIGIYRITELREAWDQGVLFARLSPNANHGLTGPLFQFYPPLISYIGLAFNLAGLDPIAASKAGFVLSLVVSGLGAYQFAWHLFGRRTAALLSAWAYQFAPYLLLNIYERGAAAESLGLALLPWLFWLFHRLGEESRRPLIVAGALAVAAEMLAHNITAFFTLPAVVLYGLFIAVRSRNLQNGIDIGITSLLGLLVSSFYWLPAVGELSQSSAEQNLSSPIAFHLVSLSQLVQRYVLPDYWGPDRFRLALWPAIFGLIGLALLPYQPAKRRLPLGILGGYGIAVLLVQLPWSLFLWESIPLIDFIQFPWRLLGLLSLCIAMLSGSLVSGPWVDGSWVGRRLASGSSSLIRVAMTAVLVLFISLVSLARLQPSLSPVWFSVSAEEIGVPDLWERGRHGFAIFRDFRPATMERSMDGEPTPRSEPRLPSLTNAPQVEILKAHPLRIQIAYEATSAFPLRFYRVLFPGWHVYVDGSRQEVTPTRPFGLVTSIVPAGSHVAELRFEQTALRQTADLLSLAGWIGLLWVGFRGRRRRLIFAFAIFGIVLGTMAGWRYWTVEQATLEPTALRAKFDGGPELIGVDIPPTWRLGEEIPLRLFWFVDATPDVELKVFFHLAQPDGSGKVAQLDNLPMRDFGTMTRWEPGEVVDDHYRFVVDESVPPGDYSLLMGVYDVDTVTNAIITTDQPVLPGERLVLGQIVVE